MVSTLQIGLLRPRSGPPDPATCESCRLLWKALHEAGRKDYELGAGVAYFALARHIEVSHAEYINTQGEE